MENKLLMIVVGIIILLLILWVLISFIKRKAKSDEELTQEERNLQQEKEQMISKMKSPQKTQHENFTMKKGGIFDQKPNPIPIVKEKAMSWTTSSSYEEDVQSKERVEEIHHLKIQVLLVDDSLTIRRFVSDVLKDNYDIILKNDGLEAFEYLKNINQKPELIISDMEMPNMNGHQLIDEIRKINKFNNTPILVISAYAEKHLILMEEEKIQGFIEKPFKPEDLKNQVAYLLNTPYKYIKKELG